MLYAAVHVFSTVAAPPSFPFGYTLCRNSLTNSRCHSNRMTAASSPRSRRRRGKRAAADTLPPISLSIHAATRWCSDFLAEPSEPGHQNTPAIKCYKTLPKQKLLTSSEIRRRQLAGRPPAHGRTCLRVSPLRAAGLRRPQSHGDGGCCFFFF